MQLENIGSCYSMYTRKGSTLPSPFTFVHTKVAHTLSPIYLPSMFSTCIQDDVTSQRFSLSIGFKKTRLLTPKRQPKYWISKSFDLHVDPPGFIFQILPVLLTLFSHIKITCFVSVSVQSFRYDRKLVSLCRR